MSENTLERLLSQVKVLKIIEKKTILGRERLRLSNEESSVFSDYYRAF